MRSFSEFYALACQHKGGSAQVDKGLPRALNAEQLKQKDDAFYLSAMSRRIFRAGLKHAMVDAKWNDFERVFSNFDPHICAMMSDDFLESCMSDTSLIRHLGKLKTIRSNAQFVQELARQKGGFGHYLAAWPIEETVELWFDLKKQGAHLGGYSAPQFLRMVGRDTFLLSQDVLSVLRLEGLIDDAEPKSKVELRKIQAVFNEWRAQSGKSLCEISRVISYTAM